MSRVTIGVLIVVDPTRPMRRPSTQPIGRAAKVLAEHGIDVLIGDRAREGHMSGFVLDPSADTWRRVDDVPVAGVYDRYTSQKRPEQHASLLAALGGVPVGNPEGTTLLCRDKIASQRLLETVVPMPELLTEHQAYEARLAAWGAGFLKPRYGAYGRGVTHVTPGDPLPRVGPSTLPEILEPLLLQRAVPAPEGWGGVSVRQLAQRRPDGSWTLPPAVARRSPTDPVVNVHRGAEPAPAEDVLSPATMETLRAHVTAGCECLADRDDGGTLLELGWDAVIDPAGEPWIIEVNSRPRGRLECLAAADPARFEAAHIEACARPLRYLASLR